MRAAQAVERLPGRACFRRSWSSVEDPLEGLRGALEILLAEGADDPDVQQRFRMIRIDRQRSLRTVRARDRADSCSSS